MMPCDHDATRKTLTAFANATTVIGVMSDGADGWLLLGRCAGCGTTLAVPIDFPRGHAVHGEISTNEGG